MHAVGADSGATVGTVTFAALPSSAHTANQTGFTVTVPLVSGGRELTITSTEIDVVRGTQLQQVTFNGNGTAFPAQLEGTARAGCGGPALSRSNRAAALA
jgi:hypothetical protein